MCRNPLKIRGSPVCEQRNLSALMQGLAWCEAQEELGAGAATPVFPWKSSFWVCRVSPGAGIQLSSGIAVSLCSAMLLAAFVAFSWGCHFGFPRCSLGLKTLENVPRASLVFPLPHRFCCQTAAGERLCVFLSFPCFCGISVFLSQNELCRSLSHLLCLAARARDSLQENVHLLCGVLCSPHLCRG